MVRPQFSPAAIAHAALPDGVPAMSATAFASADLLRIRKRQLSARRGF
jgi:hypothetical protein